MNYRTLQSMSETRKRKLGNNTYLEVEGDVMHVKLHRTRIVSLYRDGRIRLDSGGWKTVTTKARMNEVQGVSVWQRDYVWYVGCDGKTVPFEDGMVVGFKPDVKRIVDNEITLRGGDPKVWTPRDEARYAELHMMGGF